MAATSAGPPIAGAYLNFSASCDDMGVETEVFKWALPAGMSVVVIAVSMAVRTSAGTINIRVGTAADDDAILTDKAPTTTATSRNPDGASAVSSRVTIAAGGDIQVTVNSGTSAEGVQVNVMCYVVDHATNIQPD